MPSTLRVVIAAKNANAYVERNLDDVLNSNFGRSVTLDFPLGQQQDLVWPLSGETLVYLRFPQLSNDYTVAIKSINADEGFTFTVEAETDVGNPVAQAGIPGFTPILLPIPNNMGDWTSPTLSITTSVVVSGVEAIFI